jgi:hypothetical protein
MALLSKTFQVRHRGYPAGSNDRNARFDGNPGGGFDIWTVARAVPSNVGVYGAAHPGISEPPEYGQWGVFALFEPTLNGYLPVARINAHQYLAGPPGAGFVHQLRLFERHGTQNDPAGRE